MSNWNPKNLDEVATEDWSFYVDGGIINSANWSPDGTLLVVNCLDFLVVLNGETGEEVKRLEGLDYSRSRSFWSNDGSLLFSHIYDSIRVWDTETWSEVRRIKMSSCVDSFAVDPKGSTFATGYNVCSGLQGYGRVDLLRTADGSNIAKIETKGSLSGVTLSPSCQLATWSNSSSVKVWDVDEENVVVQTFQIAKGIPTRTIWSPSESLFVVATSLSELYVFDVKSGKQLLVRDSHGDKNYDVCRVNALAFSSDESWFASKGIDGKVLAWRTTDWSPFAVFQSKSPFSWRGRTPPLLGIKPGEPVLLTQNDDCSGLTVWRLCVPASTVLSTNDTSSTIGKSSTEQLRNLGRGARSERGHHEPLVISLGELKRLGEFTRRQDVGEQLRAAGRERGPLQNYPLFAGWSEPGYDLDVFDGSRWKRVIFRAWDGKQITYEYRGEEKQLEFHRNTVAPAGHLTEFREDEVHISNAELSTEATFPRDSWIVVSSELVHVKWPYVTLRVTKCPPNAGVARASSVGNCTFHVADPRLIVNGVRRPPPLFNSAIAVSHRWREEDHPDRSGAQYRELLDRAASMKLHPMQPFLIDYCSLPQKPWSPEEKEIFVSNILPFHKAFSSSSIIIKHGAEDYSTRAWCMLELMLIGIEGWLADGPGKLRGAPELPPGLDKTWEEAENYVKLTTESKRNLVVALNDSPPNPWEAYLSDGRSMAFQQAKENQQRRLLRLFDKELIVGYEPDRRHIKKLLRELVFRSGPF